MSFSSKRLASMVLAALVATLTAGGCGPGEEDADFSDDADFSEGEGAGYFGDAATNREWWRNKSQADRSQRILDRGLRDVGRDSGLNCKEWARRVISDASRGAVVIPPTYPDAWGWSWYDGAGVSGMNADIRDVRPGSVVQMNIPARGGGITPHTAIVAEVSSTGITWLDSNYVAHNYVATHFQTFADFERATLIGGRNRYSVYVIVGTY